MRSLKEGIGWFVVLFAMGVIWAGTLASSAAEEGLIFYLPFEDSIDAAEAAGKMAGASEGEISFVKGYKGRGIKLSPGAELSYEIQDNFNVPTGTIMFWFNPDWEINGEGKYWFFQNSAVDIYRILWKGKSSLSFRAGSGSGYLIHKFGIPDIPPGKWTHLALTWDENKGEELYINGESVAKVEGIWKASLAKWNKRFKIQARVGKEEAGKSGVIDEYKIFNKALSGDEIKSILMAAEGL